MQIVKSDTYRVLNIAVNLYLSICAYQLINILWIFIYTYFIFKYQFWPLRFLFEPVFDTVFLFPWEDCWFC